MSLQFGPVFIAQTQLESHKSERSHDGLLDQPESGGQQGTREGGVRQTARTTKWVLTLLSFRSCRDGKIVDQELVITLPAGRVIQRLSSLVRDGR